LKNIVCIFIIPLPNGKQNAYGVKDAKLRFAFMGPLFAAPPHRQRLHLWKPPETEFLDFQSL
jgi:hypothetical protein